MLSLIEFVINLLLVFLVTVNRKYRHLKPVDVNNHTSKPRQKRSSSSGASGSSGRSKASLVQPSAATEKPKLMTADQSAVSVTDTPR